MLWFGWHWVLVLDEEFLDESGHTRVERPCVIVPLESNPNVFCTFPVHCNVVVSLQRLFEVVGVFIANEFDSKVVDYQSESDWSPHVFPQSWRELARVVPCGIQPLDK